MLATTSSTPAAPFAHSAHRRSGAPRGRRVLAAVAIASVLVPAGSAVAGTGDPLREGVRNGTASQETEIIGRLDATGGAKGGYVTRQSNTQEGPRAGGAAIYGCRAAAGGSLAGSAPCLRASNLANGFAFEFASRGGAAGAFLVDDPREPSARPPFVTNARGLVANLNAERVGGFTAAELVAAAQQGGLPGAGGAGAPGPKGDKGDPGERGPSNGYAIREGFLNLSNAVATEQTLRTLSLPRDGAYMVSITAEASWQSGSDVGNVICRARSTGSNAVVASVGSNLGAAGAGRQPRDHYALTFPYTRDAQNTGIAFTCQHGAQVVVPGIAQVQNATVTAIQVAELDDQTP